VDSAPLPFELRLSLRRGTVYYFQHRGLHSDASHYFVVMNTDPQRDTVLLLAVASSQVDKIRERRRNLPPETLVEVAPSEYEGFIKPTLIDCNQVFELDRAELVSRYQAKSIRSHPDLPVCILNRVRDGILASPRVDEAYKELIRPS
jgi:hypothetical protein